MSAAARPLVVCIERLDAPVGASEMLRCVALPGRQPGLTLGARGQVHWMHESREDCLLGVSGDEQLVLWRPQGSTKALVRRAGRELSVPDERVVILLDGDELDVGGGRVRVHLHGVARKVRAPLRMRLARMVGAATIAGSVATASAASLALASGCEPPAVEQPGTQARPQQPGAPPDVPDPATTTAEAGHGADAATEGGLDAAPSAPAAEPLDAGIPGTAAAETAATGTPSASLPSQPSGSAPRPTAPQKRPPIEMRPMPPFAD